MVGMRTRVGADSGSATGDAGATLDAGAGDAVGADDAVAVGPRVPAAEGDVLGEDWSVAAGELLATAGADTVGVVAVDGAGSASGEVGEGKARAAPMTPTPTNPAIPPTSTRHCSSDLALFMIVLSVRRCWLSDDG